MISDLCSVQLYLLCSNTLKQPVKLELLGSNSCVFTLSRVVKNNQRKTGRRKVNRLNSNALIHKRPRQYSSKV